MRRVDLNADVGEECGDDAALLAIVTSANVAAGGHAGGGAVLEETIRLAAGHDVAVGAHPSYPDRTRFGRHSHLSTHGPVGVRTFVAEQVAAVLAACRRQGVPMTHVKAHGALYGDASADPEVAEAFLAGVRDAVGGPAGAPVAIVGPVGSALEVACRESGTAFVAEIFADRAYTAEGTLVPRTVPGAVLGDPDAVASRALRMVAEGRVETIEGGTIRIVGDTVCLHGDTARAVDMARAVRRRLEATGVAVLRHDALNAGEPEWYGDCAVSVPIGEVQDRLAAVDLLADALPEHEVRVGMTSVLIVADEPDATLRERIGDLLRGARASLSRPARDRLVELEVTYDGADLGEAAGGMRCSVADLIDAHQRQAWRVAMMGFAPGFGYLVPDGPAVLPWSDLRRRDTPRPAVPAGSVALAAGMSAVYPAAMPGGWHLLGRCEATLFDPVNAMSPTTLQPGDRVRFRSRSA